MPDNQAKLAEVIGYLTRGEDVPEMDLRWAAQQFGFEWTPTQQELRAKLIELGHLSA